CCPAGPGRRSDVRTSFRTARAAGGGGGRGLPDTCHEYGKGVNYAGSVGRGGGGDGRLRIHRKRSERFRGEGIRGERGGLGRPTHRLRLCRRRGAEGR